MLREELIRYLNNPTIKQSSEKTLVESFKKIDNAWLPSQTLLQITNTGVDNSQKTLVEKYRLLEFKPESVAVDLLFEPLLSPGTLIYHLGEGARVEVAGGDTADLVTRLQEGDFSIFKEDIKELNQP